MKDRTSAIDFFRSKQSYTDPDCLFVTDSGVPGPHLLIAAGIHGHEPVGVKAIIKFLAHLRDHHHTLTRGKISWLLGNPKAFQQNKRFLDVNLNRAFTGESAESYEHQRAEIISKYIYNYKDSIDIVMDLHSVSVGDFTTAATIEYPGVHEKIDTYTLMNRVFTYTKKDLQGSMIGYCHDIGVFGVAIECGNNKDSEAYHTAMAHINHLVTHFEMIDPDCLPSTNGFHQPESVTHLVCLQAIEPKEDFQWLIPLEVLDTGYRLKAGERYAQAGGEYYIAPEDCELFIPDANPHPDDHDAGFLCKRLI